MSRKSSFLSGVIIILLVVIIQTASQGNQSVFAGGNYPYLGQEAPLNWPNCTPNATTTIASNNIQIEAAVANPAIKVICLTPGTYSEIKLDISGTDQSPRYLIPNHTNGQSLIAPWNQPSIQRVKVNNVLIKADYWNVRGLNIVSDDALILEFKQFAHDNVVDTVLIEGISERVAPDDASRTMTRIREEAYYNHIQNSVLRNPPRVPRNDSHCLVIRDSRYNTVINNQIYDCAGDGIQINTEDTIGWDNRGNKIINNEIYLTSRLYASCSDTSIDANLNGPGNCACAENGLDIKFNVDNPVSNSQDKTEIRSNIMYGFQETHPTCGGTGDKTAPAIYLQNLGTQDILIEGNVIALSDTGIQFKDTGSGGPDNISVLNNLLYNITENRALHIASGSNNQFSHNTIVLTLDNGNIMGRNSIAIVGSAQDALISNNLFISSNINYRGYTDLADTSGFIFRNNGYVQLAAPVPEIPGTNDMIFPNDSLNNYGPFCFKSSRFIEGKRTCYSYLMPGMNSATVDTIFTTTSGVPYDFRYITRVLPYDLGATEVPLFSSFNFMPAVTK